MHWRCIILNLEIYICFILIFSRSEGNAEDSVSRDIINIKRLKNKLFADYDKDIRPAFRQNDTVTVNTALFLLSVVELNEVSGTIVLSMGIFINWMDFRLIWNESDYGGINQISLHAETVWKPKLFILSSAEDLQYFGSEAFDVRLYSNGMCSTIPGKLVKSSCTIDMTHFPTDSQTCSLLLSPWGYRANEIALSFSNDKIIMNYFNRNGEWDVVNTSVTVYNGYGPGVNILSFSLYLKRKSRYFIISVMTPVYILCFLNPFVFLLPASSGERVSYTVTMFLAVAVYMTIIGDSMPKVSEPMSGFSYFLLVAMIFNCLLIIFTIFSLRLHSIHNVNELPSWLFRSAKCFYKMKVKASEIEQSTYQISEGNNNRKEQLENISNDMKISDITTFIDIALFITAEIAIIAAAVGFTLHFYKLS